MKACIVFAHEGSNSFNHEILKRVSDELEKVGIEYTVRDLYQMDFQPVFSTLDMKRIERRNPSSDIEEEQTLITDCDLLVMMYPVWWWSAPAILKGYIDRVFTDGFAFRYEENGPVGLLGGKQALVFTTTRESAEEMAAKGLDEVVRKQIVEGTLEMIGYDVTYENFAAVPYVDEAARKGMLDSIAEKIASLRLPVGV